MTHTYTRTGKMVERKIRDEHILIPIGDNLYELDSLFTLNEVASFIWGRTEQGVPAPRVVEHMMERYDVQSEEAEADTQRILAELVEIGALEIQETAD